MRKTYQCAVCLFALFLCLLPMVLQAQELVRFGGFDTWITRSVKESILVGGKTVTLYEVGPKGKYEGARAYTNQGGSPWATSNVLAKVYGVVKTNVSVYPDTHRDGQCAKLYTHLVTCKAVGVVNISALASGSIFLGSVLEPITGTSDPMGKLNMGIPFTRRPKAVRFDYKYHTPGTGRIRETGFGKTQQVSGKDMGQLTCLLQKRWEDADGGIHALRIGTLRHYFSQNTSDWVEDKEMAIHYGDITREPYYKDYMGLVTGKQTFYAVNSQGRNVPIIEEGWASADETPTHVILKFDSSHGGAYVGTIGNTLWVDNVRFVY